MNRKIVAINGSYRREGITSQAVAEAAAGARAAGAEVSVVDLLDERIEFCTNCRACMQAPGEKRGACVLKDGMAAVLELVDAADGLILAAPVNHYNVTALFRRFLERTACYGYWPWGMAAPKYRIKKPSKQAVLITSSGMPSLFGRVFTGALRALGLAAASFGARTAGTMFIGMIAMREDQRLSEKEKARARALGRLLA